MQLLELGLLSLPREAIVKMRVVVTDLMLLVLFIDETAEQGLLVGHEGLHHLRLDHRYLLGVLAEVGGQPRDRSTSLR